MKKIVQVLLAIVFITDVNSQTAPNATEPLPFMVVPNDEGEARVRNFNRNQRKEIRTKRGVALGFKTSEQLHNFKGLLDYLVKIDTSKEKIKFLRFDLGIPDGTSSSSKWRKMIFIITAYNNANAAMSEHFVLDKAFDPKNPSASGIINDQYLKWRNNYEVAKPGMLLDPKDLNNHPDSNINTPASDTRFVTFCFADFASLFVAVGNHTSLGEDIICTLGSTGASSSNSPFKNRTTVQITLLDTSGHRINVQAIKEFSSVRAPSQCPQLFKDAISGDDIDNGQLCPFHCPK